MYMYSYVRQTAAFGDLHHLQESLHHPQARDLKDRIERERARERERDRKRERERSVRGRGACDALVLGCFWAVTV
jgi:hypothetical protein